MKGNGRWRARRFQRLGYDEHATRIIMLYNEICVPAGFWPVDAYSEQLQQALSTFDWQLAEYREMFLEAVEEKRGGESGYTTPRGAKLIRIVWNNY